MWWKELWRYFKRHRIKIEWKQYLLSIVLSIVSIMFFIFDKGPDLPPMPEEELLDCHFLSLQQVENNGGKLTFTVEYGDPVQYPMEYYLHFLNITIAGEGNSVEFWFDDYQNITFRGNKMIFNVILPFGGRLNINAKCGTRALNQQEVTVERLEIYYSSLSSMDWSRSDVARYKNVCLENNTLTFIKWINVNMKKEFEFDAEIFNVNETNTTIEDYMNQTNATFLNQTSYFISDFNGDTFHDYFAILNPILAAYFRDLAPKNSSFLLPEDPSNETISRIHKYAPNVDIMKRRDGVICYRDLVFTSSKSTLNKSMFDSLVRIPFTHTISSFKLRTIEEKKVVVASSLWSNVGALQELCDDCEFYEFKRNEMNLEEISSLVSSANVFIANHIKDLVFVTLLDRSSKAAVIDASNVAYSCQEWASKLSGTARYMRLYNDPKKCNCRGFDCYPEEPEDADVSGDIADVFIDALTTRKYNAYV